MSEKNTEKAKTQETPNEKQFVWQFEGKTYPLFLANKTGSIAMPIIHPQDNTKKIGIISANFAWETDEPFLDRLDIARVDKANLHDEWTKRENESLTLKNAKFFSETVQFGTSTDIDDTGEKKEEILKSRQKMLAYRKPVQSDLVGFFLRECHIERFLPEGVTKLDALLAEPEELIFTMKIGDYNNPAHLILLNCNVPSDEAITNYQKDSFTSFQNNDGDWRYGRDNQKRLNFARKFVKTVQGAMLGPVGELEFDDSQIVEITPTDEKAIQTFLKNFNPDWLIKLADEIAGAFNLGKK